MERPLDRRALLKSMSGLALFSGLGGGACVAATPRLSDYPFALGVASGDPWPDGFVIWTRLAPRPIEEHGGMLQVAVPVRWEVAEDERFAHVVRRGEEIAWPQLGHSVHVELIGLQPHRPYWYRFQVEGADVSPIGMVRTAPAAGATPARVRLGIGGCQSYPSGWYDAWRYMSQEPDLDAIFHYGDYIYEYDDKHYVFDIRDASGAPRPDRQHGRNEVYSLDDYRQRYALYKSDKDLQAAHHSAAFIMSFDDHEVDNDWASAYDQDGTPPEVFALRRYAAMQAWYENLPVRKAQMPRPDGLTMYRRLDYGSLMRMHVLDTRSYRNDQLCAKPEDRFCRKDDGPDSTILGPRQEAWLANGLHNNTRWNLLAQQVLVMPQYRRGVNGARQSAGGADKWDGYPAARHRLVKTITERKLTNVVIATGDAHIHAVGAVPMRDEEPDGPAAATEFMATSISSNGNGSTRLPEAAQATLDSSPNIALLNYQRGYQTFEISANELRAEVKVMDQVQTKGGKLSTLAAFIVTPAVPLVHRA